MVKILSIELAGKNLNYYNVTTNNPVRPNFYYRTDKFKCLADLQKEIEKSIANEFKRKKFKKDKKDKIIEEFNKNA